MVRFVISQLFGGLLYEKYPVTFYPEYTCAKECITIIFPISSYRESESLFEHFRNLQAFQHPANSPKKEMR